MAKNNLPSVSEVENAESNGDDKGYMTVKFVTVIGDPRTGTYRSWAEFRTTHKDGREAAGYTIIDRCLLQPAGISFDDLQDDVIEGSLVYTKDGVSTIVNPMDGAAGRDPVTGMIERLPWMKGVRTAGGLLTKAAMQARAAKK